MSEELSPQLSGRTSHDLLKQVINSMTDYVFFKGLDGRYFGCNLAYEKLIGRKEAEIVGKTAYDLNDVELADIFAASDQTVIDTRMPIKIEIWLNKADGTRGLFENQKSPLFDNNGAVIGIIGVFRDITKQKEAEKEILHLGYHDQLTGLYNRHYFEMIITEEMDRSDRYGTPLSMLLLDLDHFKTVNDTWGHPAGDDLLQLTANVIKHNIRSPDILVRFGGEEFVVLMPHTAKEGAAKAAEKIRLAIAKECHPVAGVRTVSIGVAHRMANESFRHWYRRVDEALYQAKEGGRNRVVVSDENKNFAVDTLRMNWRSEWESGNSEIDQQHQELIEIANNLVNLSFAGKGYQETEQQVGLLLDHIAHHFEFEENLLAAIGFPGYLTHARIHKGLVAKALRLAESCKNGEVKTAAFFSFVVDDVILGHLMDADTKFFPYIQKKP